jgi:hypothetical protein
VASAIQRRTKARPTLTPVDDPTVDSSAICDARQC